MSQDPYADLPQNKEEENSGWNHLDEVSVENWKPGKRERDRDWEKKKVSHSYRGVRPEVHQHILALAKQLMVSAMILLTFSRSMRLLVLNAGIFKSKPIFSPKRVG